MKTILSTCGTSILTNGANPELRAELNKCANEKEERNISEEVKDYVSNRRAGIAGLSVADARHASAELNGLLAYYNSNIRNGSGDMHYLLATDTWLGRQTAEAIKAWLEKQGVRSVSIITFAGLQTSDAANFHDALSEILKWCKESLTPADTVFNLSGGFKSETGFLQIVGMFYANEIVYLFETGELMRIPRLPVKFTDRDAIVDYLKDFRRAALGLNVAAGKSSIYWNSIAGLGSILTVWGSLVFNELKDEIYGEKIWDAPSAQITLTKEFIKSCNKLSEDRRKLINEKIDLLAQYMESSGRLNPNSLNVHAINTGKTSHECYAWSDKDAKRIYLNIEGNSTELIELGEHL